MKSSSELIQTIILASYNVMRIGDKTVVRVVAKAVNKTVVVAVAAVVLNKRMMRIKHNVVQCWWRRITTENPISCVGGP
jgi:hypothetical protein